MCPGRFFLQTIFRPLTKVKVFRILSAYTEIDTETSAPE